ncbi:MAG: TM0106 family RecB-like putative nuclease [Actinomycetota bacterium]|nr:TM0106 family RecB-like putative nuclease [Actinomycetota bacterium]
MYESDEMLLFVSPTDLTKYLACAHLTRLDLAVARGELAAPAEGVDEMLEILFTQGDEHEQRYLQSLRDRGRAVIEIARPKGDADALRAAELATEEAMANGADVLYQATFFDGRWRGHADFLLRRDDRPGRWAWSYDVADTKLARRMKVPALLQMATYAERLTSLQGIEPEQLIVVTGDRLEHEYRFADCAAYAKVIRAQLLEFIEAGDDPHPQPVQHCSQCRWQPRCMRQWRDEDDLSLVAFMTAAQATRLRAADVATVRDLGTSLPTQLPVTIGAPARERLAAQARLQLVERDTGDPVYELLAAEENRGLALLPEPSPGDVFFDIEGDPFRGDHGLEYLWGVVQYDTFTPYWATDVALEKQAFEQLVDHLIRAWDADPGMHVYHYAPYEPARLKSLSGRYGTRGTEVDRLLRGQRLVDLYAVVRQGMRISKESYSIKKLEAFYWGRTRAHEGVSEGLGSVVAFERWIDTGEQSLLDDIASYNEDDCRSTAALRDWLETRRTEGGGDAVYPRPLHGDGSSSETAAELADELGRIAAVLCADVPALGRDDEQQARWLLAGLLDWHRRESLPEWWEHFDRLKRSDEELVFDAASVGELSTPREMRVEKQSTVWRLWFPPQDTKMGPDTDCIDPRTTKSAGTVVAIDAEQGWLELKLRTSRGAPKCTSIVPTSPIADAQQRARLRELGEWVIAHGIDSQQPQWQAARGLLLGRPPRSDRAALRRPGEPAEQALCRLAAELDRGVLPVQGPPGTGKTWAGARMILRLVAEGKRVGITGFSHKVIGNLVNAVVAAAAETGVDLDIVQKAAEHERCTAPGVQCIDAPKEVEAALAGRLDIVAGTSWLFAREGFAEAVDVLVVDEAGQLSLANVLAISHAAKSLVLLGDPQQLAQPVKGHHPDGVGASALEHLLAGRVTIPADRGLLLDTTWRMHSDVAAFVSHRFYDGRLQVEPGCELQRVSSAAPLGGTGLRFVPVAHQGNTVVSTEEIDAIRTLCAGVLADGQWTDRDGVSRALTGADILVLAPFNAQVNRLRSRLSSLDPAIRIGTVDKFQGQEAPIVIYSITASSVDDAPRGLEFLYSLNRFNVAISRARGVAAVVCSPRLLSPLVGKPEQLRMVNALCAFAEEAKDALSVV